MSRVPFEEDRKYQSKERLCVFQLNICVSIVLENNQLLENSTLVDYDFIKRYHFTIIYIFHASIL